ncbi:DUF3862 domain-containing protein [Bacillus sp. 37MA]|uniref:DUF3862 domain-containing protein n=1 Tax=Bacillus sp. 37MA TaxID=1132442 RepID=UPI00037935E5|nr:DUF3862 domain-containing protein [Bacillus sp. 37MA]
MGKLFKLGCFGLIALIIIIIVIITFVANGGDDATAPTSSTGTTTEAPAETSEPAPKGVLTQDKFDQIKDGMSYEEVVGIIGSEGELLSETGEAGTEFHTLMYQWTSSDTTFGNASFMFQGGKLISKAQAGLGKSSDVKITAEEFNQIQNGMSYAEVQEIVGGAGELTSETGSEGDQFHMTMITYYGDSLGANAILSFTADKLDSKTQLGLE